MPTLRITITAELPENALDAFRERHAIEAYVLDMLDSAAPDREINVDMIVEDNDAKAAPERRGPGRPRGSKNGAAREELLDELDRKIDAL